MDGIPGDSTNDHANCENESLKINSVAQLKEITAIQCSDGNWNYNPYMHGLANGMILAIACLENKEPEYLEAPDAWLKDVPNNDKPITVSVI